MFADGRCEQCGHRYVQDLPSGHGMLYPATLDVDTGETLQAGDAPWFAAPLRDLFERPDGDPVTLEVRGRARDPAVLLNCLDPIYGHSVLKLLNAQGLLREGRELIVLAPESLDALLPGGAAALWIVREPTRRFSRWLLDLEERIDHELAELDDCVLSPAAPHPAPSGYDLGALLGAVEPAKVGNPSVVFSLRADRLWGRDAADQRERVGRLWRAITAAFPEAGGVAVGTDPGGLPPGIEDATVAEPATEVERRWLALMRGADLAFGVHGSNMLLPSGLARATLELLPATRYGNAFQATLLNTANSAAALVRHRTMYGADDLSDLDPSRVAEVAVSVLRYTNRSETLLSGERAARGLPAVERPVPASAPRARPQIGSISARRAVRRLVGATRQRAARSRRRLSRPSLPVLVRDERGLSFELETAEEVERFAAAGGHLERDELALVSAYLTAGMTAFDVGANMGVFTATMAAAAGPSGPVHAFEPLPSNRRRLERTIALNGTEQVHVSASVVTDTDGRTQLYDYGAGYESWATLVPREIEIGTRTVRPEAKIEVDAVTLDRYCHERNIERIDVLKIDVEGAEERVLGGASGLLERRAVDLLIVEVADTTLAAGGASANALVESLESHGLRTLAILDGELRPFRIAGEHLVLTNVVAASARARERLSGLGALR
jgi:FkbM family methyltransferase